MQPDERCDPDRVHIELIVISFIRHDKFKNLAQKLGGGSPSRSRSGSVIGPETTKVIADEFKKGVKDMCKDATKEARPELLQCFMDIGSVLI